MSTKQWNDVWNINTSIMIIMDGWSPWWKWGDMWHFCAKNLWWRWSGVGIRHAMTGVIFLRWEYGIAGIVRVVTSVIFHAWWCWSGLHSSDTKMRHFFPKPSRASYSIFVCCYQPWWCMICLACSHNFAFVSTLGPISEVTSAVRIMSATTPTTMGVCLMSTEEEP